jgi:hypothetical protein
MVNIIDLFVVWFGPYIVLGVLLGLLVIGFRVMTS